MVIDTSAFTYVQPSVFRPFSVWCFRNSFFLDLLKPAFRQEILLQHVYVRIGRLLYEQRRAGQVGRARQIASPDCIARFQPLDIDLRFVQCVCVVEPLNCRVLSHVEILHHDCRLESRILLRLLHEILECLFLLDRPDPRIGQDPVFLLVPLVTVFQVIMDEQEVLILDRPIQDAFSVSDLVVVDPISDKVVCRYTEKQRLSSRRRALLHIVIYSSVRDRSQLVDNDPRTVV